MSESDEEYAEPRYTLSITDEAFYSLVDIVSDRVVSHVFSDIELLEASPLLGGAYDPVYEAAKPPVPCRVLYCEYLGIYYHVNGDEHSITVFAIIDQRRNPETRFDSYEYRGIEL